MKTRYITEKDFVPTSITHFWYQNETEKGLYQIVYGVLQRNMSYDDIYDLVVRLSKEQKSEVVKRFKLLAWKVEVEAMIAKLRKFDVKDFKVIVMVPFRQYMDDVPYTLNLFQFVLFTINEILERGDDSMETTSNPKYDYPVKNIEELICDSFVDLVENLPDELQADVPYYRSLFQDELIRRGVSHLIDPKSSYLDKDLTPSEYFNKPEEFFQVLDMDDDHKLYKKKFSSDSDDSNDDDTEEKTPGKDKYKLGAAGAVFFMLKSMSQDAVEKKNKKKLVSLINYVLGEDYDKDTARSYVDNLLKITSKSHNLKFYQSVKETLIEYRFDVPDVIKEGFETKERERNR